MEEKRFHRDQMSALSVLVKSDAPASDLMHWYDTVSDRAKNIARTRLMNLCMDQSALEEFAVLMQDLPKPVARDAGILLIRYHLTRDEYDTALEIYKDLLTRKDTRKRHAFLLFDYLLQVDRYEDADTFYQSYIAGNPDYVVSGSDLVTLMGHPANIVQPHVFESLLSQPVILPQRAVAHERSKSFPDGETPNGPLQKIELTETQLNHLLDTIRATFNKKGTLKDYDRIVKGKKPYDYVIDGANVMFFIDRKVTLNGYQRLMKVINALKTMQPGCKTLLVLHHRHFKSKLARTGARQIIQHWRGDPNLDILQTPTDSNDDYYSILSCLIRPKCRLVTNDLFRDHIFKLSRRDHSLDLLGQWHEETAIKYNVEMEQDGKRRRQIIIFTQPLRWSRRVQKLEDVYYVPVEDGAWCVVRGA